MPEEDYAAAAARVQSSLASRGRGAGAGPRFLDSLPVSLRQVRDVYGRCFHLATRELATLDTQFQGENYCCKGPFTYYVSSYNKAG